MNEHLKGLIGKPISISHKFPIVGKKATEYVQGTIKDFDSSTNILTITQYIPYIDFLEDRNPGSIERSFNVGDIRFL